MESLVFLLLLLKLDSYSLTGFFLSFMEGGHWGVGVFVSFFFKKKFDEALFYILFF